MNTEQERAAFDAWAEGFGLPPTSLNTVEPWAAWKARAALAATPAPAPLPEPHARVDGKLGTYCSFESTEARRGDAVYTADQMRDYARAALAATPAPAPQWVPVSERLPEPDSGEVLVWLTGGRCAFDEWHTHREDPIGMSTTHVLDMGCMWRDYEFEEVTHWMPLPAAPEGQGKEASNG